jgi:hypothetical protein
MTPNIEKASKTIVSMCLDYQTEGISEKTFVKNLTQFAFYCEEELEKEIEQGENK